MPVTGKKPGSTEDKILRELKAMNKVLKELRDIVDNIWRERSPG